MHKKSLLKLVRPGLLAACALALAACGGSGTEEPEADRPDNTEEVRAYYLSKVSVPVPVREAFERGEVSQEEIDRRSSAGEFPKFFREATAADIPADLAWEDGSELPEFASPDAVKGGTHYEWLQDYPRTLRRLGPDANGSFRPYILDDVSMYFARRHPNVTGLGPNGFHYYPGIADRWAIDRENATVYVHIDETARWSDGVPVTTDDVFFMFFMYQTEYVRAPWYNNFYNRIYKQVTRFDELTFALTFNESKPDIADKALRVEPMPRHFFYELGEDYVERYQWRFVPTTGAYVVNPEDIKKGRSIALTRNENWWAKDRKFWRNRYNPDRIHFSVIRDIPKAFESFKKGELDKFGMNLAEYWYEKLPDDDPLVRDGFIHKATFFNQRPRPTYGLWMNQSKPLLDNLDVRLGITYATNWQLVIDKFFRGDYVRMQTSADGYGEFTHPTLKSRGYDIQKALEHFAKAGFTERGNDGVLVNESAQRLSFTLTSGYQSLKDVLTILREEALEVGLEFRIEVLDGTAAWKKVQEKQHDIQFSAFNVSPEMYPRYWETYHSVNAYDRPYLDDGSPNPDRKVKVQTNNLQSIAIRELDVLIEKYRGSSDADEMKALAFKIEELLYEDASFVPGFYSPKHRTGYWRWVRWPDGFNVELSRSAEQYFLFWLDPQMKRETLDAKKSQVRFEPSVRVFDQYAR